MADKEDIPPNLRPLLILEILARSGQPLTPTQINSELNLPKQTIHRLCKTLLKEGLLVKDTAGKLLRPSRRLRQIASGILNSSHTHIGRHQILVDVARKVNETVNFVVPEHEGMMYMDRIETDWAFRIQLPVGSHVPFHCTASGKTFLASLSPKKQEALVASLNLEQLTTNTHTDKAGLIAELKQISKRGYALDNEEFMQGMIAIAVPVKDTNGNFFAALAFHGPAQRLSISTIVDQVDILFEGAKKLSKAVFS